MLFYGPAAKCAGIDKISPAAASSTTVDIDSSMGMMAWRTVVFPYRPHHLLHGIPENYSDILDRVVTVHPEIPFGSAGEVESPMSCHCV